MMLGHHGKDPTLPVAKSTAGPTRQTSRTDTERVLPLNPIHVKRWTTASRGKNSVAQPAE